jgi:hypothetical protein
MASSYSTDLKIELMVTGENAGTWGDKTNDNLNVIQQAIAGYGEQSIAGGAQTTALTIANSPTLSVARNIVIKLTGTITGNQIVTVPEGIEKTWIVSNGTTGAFQVQFKTTAFGSSGTIWSSTDKGIKILYSNGTEIFPADLSTLSGTVASASIADLAVTSGKLASFAVTSARLASFAVTTVKLATNAVTAIKITQSTITQSKLASGSVGSDQLINTAVTPATYTSATITVDADGRITGASSGSAGAGMGIPTLYVAGPASGTHTAAPTANRLGVYMWAGGGGGGGGRASSPPLAGGQGGNGGYGFYNAPIAQPFSNSYAVGGQGNGGSGNNAPGQSGNGGGNTNLTNVGTVNAGNGGQGGGQGSGSGNSGNQPGSSYTGFPRTFIGGVSYGVQGNGGRAACNCGASTPGNPGNSGALIIFENTGT